jgi:hypothetical protein
MRQTSMLVTASIILGLLALAALWQSAPAQPPAQPKLDPATFERFRVKRVSDNWFVLLDSATGHCWARNTGALQWQDLGNPAK